MSKVCSKCQQPKPESEYAKYSPASTSAGKLKPHCRTCGLEAQRKWRVNNPDKIRAYNRRLYERGSKLKHKFGITREEYDAMLVAQNGVCAICRGKPKTGWRLSVDHCHQTGRVRGLLCGNCNSAIGQLGDDPLLVRAAATYLEAR